MTLTLFVYNVLHQNLAAGATASIKKHMLINCVINSLVMRDGQDLLCINSRSPLLVVVELEHHTLNEHN